MAGRTARLEDRGLRVERFAAPAPSPAALLPHRARDDRPFALCAGPGDVRLTRWSFGALEPVGAAASLEEAQREIAGFATLPRDPALPPFAGGAVGYVGYDAGWALQPKPRAPRPDPSGLPRARFHLYDAVYARDEVTREGFLVAQAGGEARLERMARALRAGPIAAPSGGLEGALAPQVSQARHQTRIREVLELIAAGEVYQVNLTYPLLGRYRGDPLAAFLRILAAPPPFAAFLQVDADAFVLSASPECFLEHDAQTGLVATYPIKGTRPRSPTPDLDRGLAAELIADPKERAEHVMIVDLLRNDLGRLARPGSVAVDGLAYLESFPTVHHLTSRVVARLPLGTGPGALLRALFPGGSITGAPKLRAMEIIDALEDGPRGVYTGTIGWLGPDGSLRTSIAIRTAQIAGGEVRFGVGGGIVADSDPAREWEETRVKAAALGRALGG